jgi:formylglycine-generating enzyme required for sulfatase activity
MPLSLKREPKTAYFYPQALGDSALEMVYIPGGEFLMGSPEGEIDRRDNEGPQHRVTIAPFFMGKSPVIQAQWNFVAGLPQVKQGLDRDPAGFKGADRPVEQVSWLDAVEFCDRLTKYSGLNYCLPSEAQWEYACRAGTETPFHFGYTLTDELANYRASEIYGDRGVKGEYRKSTTPVGQFPANAFGLRDMHGNVWEWCADHWHSSYKDAPKDGSVWLSNDEKSDRVLRGGSWIDLPRYCRSAFRDHYSPAYRDDNLGFRVVSFPQDSS